MSAFTSRRGSPILAAAAALSMLAVAVLPASAATWSTPKQIAGPGTYWASSVAAEGNNVVVSYLVNASELVYRLSADKGQTFAPPVSLGSAYTPSSVTLCGGLVAGIRGVGSSMVLDLLDMDGSPVASRTLATDRDLSATGNNITCVGGRRLATFWDEWIAGALHLKVAIVPVVEPLRSYEFDLGEAYLYRGRDITATDTRIYMAWSRADGVYLQRFSIDSGPAMKITKGSRTHLAPNVGAPGVSVAAVGNRVYVGYEYDNDGFVRISKDGGRTFGQARMLFDSTASNPASVWSLEARENVVVAIVHLGPWCIGCVGSNRAMVSTDWGRTWQSGPENVGGYMGSVALLGSGPAMRIAQSWDNRTSHETYGDPGYIQFQLGTP